MTEVPLFGQVYRVGKLDAMKQFHVARRIAPIVAALGVSINQFAAVGSGLKEDSDLLQMAGPVADVVSRMSDEDTEYVIRTCLSVVARRVENTDKWQNVQTGQHLQFADISMQIMVRLVVEVLKENLGGFFGMPTDEMPSAQNS